MINPPLPPSGTVAFSAKPIKDQKSAFETQARQTAESFEALMMGEMLKTMFSGIKHEGMFGGGQSETVYRSLLIDEYAKSLSGGNGFGIADQVYKDILKYNGSDND